MINSLFEARSGKGTLEWSDYSYNICLGCAHGCLYCYAKTQACRFDEQMRMPGEWDKQVFNPNRVKLGKEVGPKGTVMFPTSHDITPQFVEPAITTINNLLAQNSVLVVSKPHYAVVTRLCREFAGHQHKMMFRFTIGSLKASLCAFWEPGAPTPAERIRSLRHAHQEGFPTSVSVEPMLDDLEGTIALVQQIQPYVSDTIWLGRMNRIPRKYNSHVPGFEAAAALIKAQQSDEKILQLVAALAPNPKVRWKDSIQGVMAKYSSN